MAIAVVTWAFCSRIKLVVGGVRRSPRSPVGIIIVTVGVVVGVFVAVGVNVGVSVRGCCAVARVGRSCGECIRAVGGRRFRLPFPSADSGREGDPVGVGVEFVPRIRTGTMA